MLYKKEKLTEKEIEEILSLLKDLIPRSYPARIRESLETKIREPLLKELRQIELYKTPSTLDSFQKIMQQQIIQSIISPGEAVGVVAAQSIGERQTQMSFSGETRVWFSHGDEEIACFVQRMLLKMDMKDIKFHSHRGIEGRLNDESYVRSISKNGVIRLQRVTGVSMHPTNGGMLDIYTISGAHVRTTRSHGMLILVHGNVVPIEACDLTCAHRLPVWIRGDLVWDRIVTIRSVVNPPDVVYDLSVEEDETFMLQNGMFVHNTLNSFHSAGLVTKMVVTGVPRFLELLNATKEPKSASAIFSLSCDNIKSPKNIRDILRHTLVSFHMHDIVTSVDVWVDRKEEEHWYSAFEIVYGQRFTHNTNGLTIQFDPNKIVSYKIPLSMVKKKIESVYGDIFCIFSPYHQFQMDIFVDTTEIHPPQNVENTSYITTKNYVRIFLEDVVKTKILEIHICGIPNITDFFIQPQQDNVWRVETTGSNLKMVLGHKDVDSTSAYSNNMWEIYQCFGIEAAREFLIQEFKSIVSGDGSFINMCHVALIVDVMTHHGTIYSISRYGIKKEKIGVLSRASFEESLDQFLNAGFYSEKDNLHGVSAAIMVGKRSSVGTGACDVIMDLDALSSVPE